MEKQGIKAGAGSYRVAAVDYKGAVIENAVVNIGGRVFKSNGKAGFHVVDAGYLKRKKQLRDEKAQYVDDLLELAIMDDKEAAMTLGLDAAALNSICQSAGGVELGLHPDLAKFNCLPSYLDALPYDSPLYTGGLSKMRKIVEALLPIVEDHTGTTAAQIEKNKE